MVESFLKLVFFLYNKFKYTNNVISNKGSIVAGPSKSDMGNKKIIIVKDLNFLSKLLKFVLKSEKNIGFLLYLINKFV